MENIKYLDKVIFPERYIFKSISGKKFNSIDEWINYEKRRISTTKYGKKRYKNALPCIVIINTSLFRDISKCDERNSIEEISNNFDISKLYFTKDLSKVVYQFFYTDNEFCCNASIDFDFVYGNVRLDKNKVYNTNIYDCKSNMMLKVTEEKYGYCIDWFCKHSDNVYCFWDMESLFKPYPIHYIKESNLKRLNTLDRYMVYDTNSIDCTLDVMVIDGESEEDTIKIYKDIFGHDPIKIVKVPDDKWFYFN